MQIRFIICTLLVVFCCASLPVAEETKQVHVPIYISFHWHMHQPIYWPYEDIVTTNDRQVYSYDLLNEVMYPRSGAYTSWPYDAVKAMADNDLAHGGAQVSFSGSLIENLNAIASAGRGFAGWDQWYKSGRSLQTSMGNPRLDMVAFGYHHPLMALCDYEDTRKQIQDHRQILLAQFGSDVSYSKGMFPPENAFAEWMIPALVDEGIEWVFVDNIHFHRACKGYPWVSGENLLPPNPADQVNMGDGIWIQLNGLWAPSKVAPWGYRPHYVRLLDPDSGETMKTPDGKNAKMIAVPTARYMGNEDGRGGFGALNYDAVMSQLQPYNTDPDHPLLIVLHHDGDNYGGGTESYYHSNFYNFIQWVKANPDRFVATTVQDYLDKFPPDVEDIIHVEPGSWSGADNGDPEFKKWNGDPNDGYSPDRNSWGVMTAAKNAVLTAQAVAPNHSATKQAWKYLLCSQTSCYEYWDGTEMWDSHPTRACNLAYEEAQNALPTQFTDTVPPTIYKPQREPYNPGGLEWASEPEDSDFEVWSYVYDISGIEEVTLYYSIAQKSIAPQLEDSRSWLQVKMTGTAITAQTNPKPTVKALEYSSQIKDVEDALVSYYILAKDKKGNIGKSPMMFVYVGKGFALPWSPDAPTKDDYITITSDKDGFVHWGVNGWTLPAQEYWPADTTPWHDGKAVDTKMQPSGNKFSATLGPFNKNNTVESLQFVLQYADGTWGQDYNISIAN